MGWTLTQASLAMVLAPRTAHGMPRSYMHASVMWASQGQTVLKVGGCGGWAKHQRVVVRASLTHSVVTHSEMCPKGDDPATTGQQDRVIKLTTGNSAASNLGGDWVFRFNGQDSTTVSSNANTATCTVMEAAWESMANIEVCHPRSLSLSPAPPPLPSSPSPCTTPTECKVFQKHT